MIAVDIPGYQHLQLEHLVLDVNGTLACDGELIAGVTNRITRLHKNVEISIITANTLGRQHEIDAVLQVPSTIINVGREAEEKAAYVRQLGAAHTAAIGNGANDALMLQEAALAIAVLQAEGLCTLALRHADLVVPHIADALDLLLRPARLRASLRR